MDIHQSGNTLALSEAPVVHYLQQTWELAALLRTVTQFWMPFNTYSMVLTKAYKKTRPNITSDKNKD